MNNRDLIIKIAKRLDKFTLDELIVISELEDKEVKDILSNILKEQIIIKNNNSYFFNTKKSPKAEDNISVSLSEIKPIVIEEEEGYDLFLTLNEDCQKKVRIYVELINIVNKTGKKNLKQVVELYNETSDYKNISYSNFAKKLKHFEQYGFKGILPAYSTNHIESAIPKELFNYFKKYYLTKEKLSATDAIYKAQKQLQAEQKIEQPYAYSSNTFLSKLKAEFTPEQIEYFRNNINPKKEKIKIKKEIDEPLDMFFKDAAKIYFNRLKTENKFERIMHQKTDYKNHLEDYFGTLRIREITNKVIAKFKQKKFDSGYKLVSVNSYILTLKNIINSVCPKTNCLASRNKRSLKNVYALDMNILSEKQISKLLDICYEKYPLAYPVLYISLSTGASIPELLGLTWDRVDLENQKIHLKYFLYGDKLVMNKCNSTMRRLKIDNNICEILKDKYYEYRPYPEEFVFEFDTDKSAQQYIEADILLPLSKELGITKLNPSDMQHNFVNMCITQNIPLTFIQKSLGHYGIVNLIKTYKSLIENLEEENYNPLDKICNLNKT